MLKKDTCFSFRYHGAGFKHRDLNSSFVFPDVRTQNLKFATVWASFPYIMDEHVPLVFGCYTAWSTSSVSPSPSSFCTTPALSNITAQQHTVVVHMESKNDTAKPVKHVWVQRIYLFFSFWYKDCIILEIYWQSLSGSGWQKTWQHLHVCVTLHYAQHVKSLTVNTALTGRGNIARGW